MFSAAVQTADAAAKCPALNVSANSQNAANAKPRLTRTATAWQTRSSRRSASLITVCSVPFFALLWQARSADADPELVSPMTDARKLDRWDFALCAALAVAYLTLLLSTVHDLGYA